MTNWRELIAPLKLDEETMKWLEGVMEAPDGDLLKKIITDQLKAFSKVSEDSFQKFLNNLR